MHKNLHVASSWGSWEKPETGHQQRPEEAVGLLWPLLAKLPLSGQAPALFAMGNWREQSKRREDWLPGNPHSGDWPAPRPGVGWEPHDTHFSVMSHVAISWFLKYRGLAQANISLSSARLAGDTCWGLSNACSPLSPVWSSPPAHAFDPLRMPPFQGALGVPPSHTPEEGYLALPHHGGFLSHSQLTPYAGDLRVFPEKSLFHPTSSPSCRATCSISWAPGTWLLLSLCSHHLA